MNRARKFLWVVGALLIMKVVGALAPASVYEWMGKNVVVTYLVGQNVTGSCPGQSDVFPCGD